MVGQWCILQATHCQNGQRRTGFIQHLSDAMLLSTDMLHFRAQFHPKWFSTFDIRCTSQALHSCILSTQNPSPSTLSDPPSPIPNPYDGSRTPQRPAKKGPARRGARGRVGAATLGQHRLGTEPRKKCVAPPPSTDGFEVPGPHKTTPFLSSPLPGMDAQGLVLASLRCVIF